MARRRLVGPLRRRPTAARSPANGGETRLAGRGDSSSARGSLPLRVRRLGADRKAPVSWRRGGEGRAPGSPFSLPVAAVAHVAREQSSSKEEGQEGPAEDEGRGGALQGGHPSQGPAAAASSSPSCAAFSQSCSRSSSSTQSEQGQRQGQGQGQGPQKRRRPRQESERRQAGRRQAVTLQPADAASIYSDPSEPCDLESVECDEACSGSFSEPNSGLGDVDSGVQGNNNSEELGPFRAWVRKAAEAGARARSFDDLGIILWDLLTKLPTKLGDAARAAVAAHEALPVIEEEGQRDLLPFPLVELSAEDFASDGRRLDPHALSSRRAFMNCLIIALNYEYGNRRGGQPCAAASRSPSKAQRLALLNLAAQVDRMVCEEPVDLPVHDWLEELKDRKIAYDGSEVTMPHWLTLAQVEKGLPPVGVSASIDVAALATGNVRECLLHPEHVIRAAGHRLPALYQSKIWAGDDEREAIVAVRFERGIVGPIPDEAVASFDGELILSGAFGVEKRSDPRVQLPDGSDGPALRLILNLIPSNACQLPIEGDIDELPACGQLAAAVLADDETLLWSSADRKCFFYIFRLPEVWWP